MFPVNQPSPQVPTRQLLPALTEEVANDFELRGMWVSHLLKTEERLEREFAERHPLEVAIKSIFAGH